MRNEEQNLSDAEGMVGAGQRNKASVPDLNLRRRRLVRGAASIAPLVLTLRSGAVAAASCVGAKALNVTVDSSGKIDGTPGGAAAGDYCVTSVQECPDPDQPTKIFAGTPDADPIRAAGPNLFCGDARSSQTVAILSAASVTSLMGSRG